MSNIETEITSHNKKMLNEKVEYRDTHIMGDPSAPEKLNLASGHLKLFLLVRLTYLNLNLNFEENRLMFSMPANGLKN